MLDVWEGEAPSEPRCGLSFLSVPVRAEPYPPVVCFVDVGCLGGRGSVRAALRVELFVCSSAGGAFPSRGFFC